MRALSVLLLLLGVLLAGCGEPPTTPDATRPFERRCLEPAQPQYGRNAPLVASLQGPELDLAKTVVSSADEELASEEPSDSDTNQGSHWSQWTTRDGTITYHGTPSGFTRILLKGERVWPSTNEDEATAAVHGILDAVGAPGSPWRNVWAAANHSPPVDFLQARFWQTFDDVPITGTEGTLSVKGNSSPFGSNETTLDLVSLHDLTNATAPVSWGRALNLGASTLRCLFALEGSRAGDTSNLKAAEQASFAVVEESLMWRAMFTYGSGCDAQRERVVLIDAQTGAVHSVGNARRACEDRH